MREHDLLIKPALADTLDDHALPVPIRLLQRSRLMRGISAYFGGIGIRPERAPSFGRRHEDSATSSSDAREAKIV